MQSIQQDFKTRTEEIRRFLAQLKETNEAHLLTHGLDRTFTTRNTHFQTLVRRLTHAIEDFRRIQEGFTRAQRERLHAQYLVAKPEATPDELADLEDKIRGRPILQSLFTIGNRRTKETILQAEQRRLSIEGLLHGIEEIKEVSSDLVDYISTNGCEVDRIHVDVKSTSNQAQITEKSLEKIAISRIRVQKAKKAAVFLTTTIIIFLLLILIHKLC
ncbi:hypothetical protein NEHOM01_0128 [Nematocida homosporus]|uniref:uncharacterized protein n=1 Tax=Nematocida homosporus TaxID=1912981 RepID=UPI00221F93E2|nr:uncharacterized protein NEHOM01_0128 [Nematocida homosporus]KAI5184383.1 hypothetical protein NEHOM01_0128 [Nematocida homosporus]